MQTGLAAIRQAREQKMRGLVPAQEVSANWFAAYTNSHHEKRVAWQLAERQIESFLPLYCARHRWKNRCEMNLKLPLFPNYVFVRIDPPGAGARARRCREYSRWSVLDEPWRRSRILKSKPCAPVSDRGKLNPTPTSSSASGSASRRDPWREWKACWSARRTIFGS